MPNEYTTRYRIYALRDPRTPAIRYVGITALLLPNRLRSHIADARYGGTTPCCHWIRSLLQEGLRPLPTLLEATDNPSREHHWITSCREQGADLVNVREADGHFHPRTTSHIAAVCQRCGRPFLAPKDRVLRGRGHFCSVPCWHGTLEERFWGYVEKTDGCWKWNGPTGFKYGHFGKGAIRAHRYSWELHYGPIPKGLHVMHLCDNPPCTRPDHLRLGTHADNQRDMYAKGRGRKARRPGEMHPCHKLTEADVLEIRRLGALGKKVITKTAIGRQFGVTGGAIGLILSGQRWTHI